MPVGTTLKPRFNSRFRPVPSLVRLNISVSEVPPGMHPGAAMILTDATPEDYTVESEMRLYALVNGSRLACVPGQWVVALVIGVNLSRGSSGRRQNSFLDIREMAWEARHLLQL